MNLNRNLSLKKADLLCRALVDNLFNDINFNKMIPCA